MKKPDPFDTWYKSVNPNPRDQNDNKLFRRVRNDIIKPLQEDEEYEQHIEDVDVIAKTAKVGLQIVAMISTFDWLKSAI